MDSHEVKIQKLDNGVYRVCTPQEGLCVETTDEVRAQTVAEAIYCSSHRAMRSSRSGNQ